MSNKKSKINKCERCGKSFKQHRMEGKIYLFGLLCKEVIIKEDTKLYATMTERSEVFGALEFHVNIKDSKITLCGINNRWFIDCGFQGYIKDAKAGCLRCQKSIDKWKRILKLKP